ncbi:MAG: DUF1456 family protein [Lactobacillaceae bacterium]|nr:DUF1456 family protein [Lactobacillaceae bacterium]
MNNNDILIRLRFALKISNENLVKIFAFGGLQVTEKQLDLIFTKQAPETKRDEHLSMHDLEAFMNGLIISQRGVKKDTAGQPLPSTFDMTSEATINNVVIKKLKIAMSYTSDDLLSFLASAKIEISPNELSAVLRNPSHRNYKPAGDRYLRNILKGMAMQYRPDDIKPAKPIVIKSVTRK